jgi:hypothetical protein
MWRAGHAGGAGRWQKDGSVIQSQVPRKSFWGTHLFRGSFMYAVIKTGGKQYRVVAKKLR